MADPAVTVVVPVFNGAKMLHAALASVRAQTVAGWQVVVVDDGSTDDSLAVAQAQAATDERIRVLHRPHEGVSRARNAGIDTAITPWLLFLDADDWLSPQALELLLETAGECPEADCVYAGWTNIPASGPPMSLTYVPREPSMFLSLSTGCGFPLHSAIARTEAVRGVGCFDPDLATHEDWDLWLRLARSGASFRRRTGVVAFYRTDAGSASSLGRRMLADGLRVIDRAYSPDERVRNPVAAHLDGAPRERRAAVRVAAVAYAAGLMIGRGEDASITLDVLSEDIGALSVSLESVAFELYSAIPRACGASRKVWSALSTSQTEALDDYLGALERLTQIDGTERRVRRRLEDLVFDRATVAETGPVTLGYTHSVAVELSEPLGDIELPEGTDRLHCRPTWHGLTLTAVTLPASDGFVPRAVTLDACVAENAWTLLEFIMHECAGGGPAFAGTFATEGWSMFLQALWDEPHLPEADFYDSKLAPAAPVAQVQAPLGEPFLLDVLDPRPDLICNGGQSVEIELRVAGEPLWRQKIASQGNRVTAQALLAAVNRHAGFELCRAAVRRVLQGGAPRGDSLREAMAPGPVLKTRAWSALVVGQRAGSGPGGAGFRAAIFPASAASELLADARTHDEPAVQGQGTGAYYDPTLLGAPGDEVMTSTSWGEQGGRQGGDRHFFEALYASDDDPWGYTSPYEVTKYEQTLSLVPVGAAAVLEVACAGGHFTHRLARKVTKVDAVDVSELAIERARHRCEGLGNVAFRRADLFSDHLGSGYDVVVCSEVLYYAEGRDQLRAAIRSIAKALRSGGVLVTAHANVLVDDSSVPGFDWDVPFGAVGIEAEILAQGRFRLERELHTDLYRVQRYRFESGRWLRRLRAREPPERDVVAPASRLPADVQAAFRPEGGVVSYDDASQREEHSLPVLMYHRVAPEGSPSMRQWRITPDELEEQLRYLHSVGYRSVTLGDWKTATLTRQPLTGRVVALTFDDGYQDFQQYALPLLQRYGFHATLFVVTDYVGAINAWDQETEAVPLMDWDSLRRLVAHGFDVGGHTATHPRLTSLADADVVRELTRCRTALRRGLGRTPRFFAAPYGLRDRGIDTLVGACGFEIGLTCELAIASSQDSLLRLPRLEISSKLGLDQFVRLLAPPKYS